MAVSMIEIRCPNCRKVLTRFTAVYFTEDFYIVFEGKCCGEVVASGEIPILSLIPQKKQSN